MLTSKLFRNRLQFLKGQICESFHKVCALLCPILTGTYLIPEEAFPETHLQRTWGRNLGHFLCFYRRGRKGVTSLPSDYCLEAAPPKDQHEGWENPSLPPVWGELERMEGRMVSLSSESGGISGENWATIKQHFVDPWPEGTLANLQHQDNKDNKPTMSAWHYASTAADTFKLKCTFVTAVLGLGQ